MSRISRKSLPSLATAATALAVAVALLPSAAPAATAAPPDRRRPVRAPHPSARGGAAGDRPPRRLRLPARAHPRVLRAGRPDGRRLHRARPRRRPATACWSPGTSTRSAAPPTSPTHPEFAARRTTKEHRRRGGDRLVHRGLHPGRAARRCAPSSGCPQVRPENTALRRPVPRCRPSRRCSSCASGLRASWAGDDRRLPGDQAPDLLRPGSGCHWRRRCWPRCAGHGLDRPGAPVFVQSFETTNLRRARGGGPACRWCSCWRLQGAPYDLAAAGDPRTYADLATPRRAARDRAVRRRRRPEKDQVIPRDRRRAAAAPDRRWCATRTAPGCWCTPTRSGAENLFLPLAAPQRRRPRRPRRPRRARSGPSCGPASTGSSPTTPTIGVRAVS